MMLFCYRTVVQPLVIFFIFSIGLFFKKIRQSLALRFNKKYQLAKASKNSKPIWIHCSSGEFEYAKPVLRLLKKNNYKTLVTFFSPSYANTIAESPLVDYAHPLPFDIVGPVRTFINHFKPQKILFARTDVWPELLMQAKSFGVPTLLFSRTQKKKGSIATFFDKWKFQDLSAIDFVSEDDMKNFKNLLSGQFTQVSGDTRYDEVIHRTESPKKLIPITKNKFTIVLGSVWPEDLKKILTPVFVQNCQKNNINLVIAPHEIDSKTIKNIKTKLNNDAVLYSECKEWSGQQHLIVDKYGILFEMYQWADLAFVGGSFKKEVHSVMEPLAWGVPVVVGPKNHNNREAQEFKRLNIIETTTAIYEMKNDQDLISHIQQITKSAQQIQKTIQDHVLKKCGASQKTLKWIEQKHSSFVNGSITKSNSKP